MDSIVCVRSRRWKTTNELVNEAMEADLTADQSVTIAAKKERLERLKTKADSNGASTSSSWTA